MDCIFCKGSMTEGITTDFTDLGSCMVIVKNVPCMICEQCGETAFIGTVVRKLDEITNKLKDSLTEIAVVQFSEKVA
jgi:YgiT-type zinc finger domain-containing protein